MKTARPSAWILSVLVALSLSPLAARSDEETGGKTKMQKKPAAEAAKPAEGPAASEKAKAAAEHPAWRTIEGTVIRLFPDRHAILIRTHVNEYQVFTTPQSDLTLDGQPAKLESLKPGDRVDACEYSAKNVVHKMAVTSAAKARYQAAAPEKKP